MENMNLFDMLGDFGIKTPVVEKKENKVEKKVEKKVDKNSVKNSLKLPGIVLLNNWGKLELTAESLGVDTPSAPNTVVEQYIKENIPCADIYTFSYEEDTLLCTYGDGSSSIDIKEGDKFYFDGLEIDLSDVCDNDVKSVDLVNHLNENGYSLDKDTLFAKKNHVIMPSLKSAADKDIRAGLMFPVTIKIPGAEEISVDGTGEVNTKTLSEAVVKIYPALKGKLKFIALDKALNQVTLNFTISASSTNTKKFKIKPDSVIKWEGYYTIPHNMDGEYSLEEICQYFADNIPENDSEGLRDYFVKKNVAERIEITPHKEFNLFYICLKGGRKG